MNDNTTIENMHMVLHTQVYRAVSHTTSHTEYTHKLTGETYGAHMTYVNHLVVTETCGTVINSRDDWHGHVSPTHRIR